MHCFLFFVCDVPRESFPCHLPQIVIVEGLYLLYDKGSHEGVSKLWDVSIFIESDLEKCIERLKERNKCIPG